MAMFEVEFMPFFEYANDEQVREFAEKCNYHLHLLGYRKVEELDSEKVRDCKLLVKGLLMSTSDAIRNKVCVVVSRES